MNNYITIKKINEVLVAEKHLSVKACQTIALVVKLQLQQRLNANPQNAAIAQLSEDCDELRRFVPSSLLTFLLLVY